MGQTDAEAAGQSLCLSADLCSRLVQKQTKVALLFKTAEMGIYQSTTFRKHRLSFKVLDFQGMFPLLRVEKKSKKKYFCLVFVKVTVNKT